LPADVWQIVLGRGSAIGAPLVDNAKYLMFTGSTAVGKRMAEQAGARLIGSSMELGGKNAMLVLDDADLDRTVEGAVRACFSSSNKPSARVIAEPKRMTSSNARPLICACDRPPETPSELAPSMSMMTVLGRKI